MTPSQTIQTEPGLLCRKVGKPDQDSKQGTDAKDSSIFEDDSSNIEDCICEEHEETDISTVIDEDSHLDYDADVDVTDNTTDNTAADYHDEMPEDIHELNSQGCKNRLSMVKETISKSWMLFGIEFAPIILPLERRLQTLAVFVWIWSIIFLGAVSTFVLLYMVAWTRFWWVALAYFTWMIVDRKTAEHGGRSDRIKTWVRGWSLWKHYVNYFPIRLIKTADLDPSCNYMFGSHPHGILSSGAFGSLATDGANADKIFSGFKVNVHTLALNFWFPINREWILALGGVNASKESISHLLSKPGGQISVIVVGGAAESMYTSPNQISLVLTKRKGFIKIALKHGAQLVPTFSFGEAHVYTVLDTPEGSWIRTLQEKFRHVVGFAPVLFFGRGVFNYNLGIIPHRRPITVVTGAPINIKKTTNPTVEEIERVHAEYTAALVELYNKYNPVYGDQKIKLNII